MLALTEDEKVFIGSIFVEANFSVSKAIEAASFIKLIIVVTRRSRCGLRDKKKDKEGEGLHISQFKACIRYMSGYVAKRLHVRKLRTIDVRVSPAPISANGDVFLMTNYAEGQQLQHETEMLTRRLTIARTTLETISKEQWAPEVLKTARETLDTLDTLDGLDALKIFYRKTSVGNQQLQYECSIAERKMAIARAALETIANHGETDAGVRKLARETLDGFSVLSDGEKFMGFFLNVQQGEVIAPVDPIDLQNFHEKWESVSAGLGKGGAIGLGALALGSAAAEAGPLWFRNSLLGIVLTQGLLADWQQGTELDGSVYRVAATIPLNGVQFDPDAFVTRLTAERRA